MKIDTFKIIKKIRVGAIAVALCLMTFAFIKCEAHTFDCEGPSGEAMIAEEHAENERNKEAYERCIEGSGSQRDFQRGDQYIRDNVARSQQRLTEWTLWKYSQK